MGDYVWPVPGQSRISSKFVYRKNPVTGASEFHTGIDIPAPYGHSIVAARPGSVTMSRKNGGYGNMVAIDHGGGLMTRYGHNSKLVVKEGQRVTAGQKIAEAGSTGQSTGNHCHFEVKINGKYKNPEQYVNASCSIKNYTGTKGESVPPISSDSSNTSDTDTSQTVQAPAKKEISAVVVKSTIGDAGAYKYNLLRDNSGTLEAGYEILIENDKIYMPAVEGDITLELSRKGMPGTLKFNVMKDAVLSFQEGNPVRFRVQGETIFFGYVFTKTRKDDHIISVTAYDQLRYLKNKDTLQYAGLTYSALLKKLTLEYGLICGEIEDTGYKLPPTLEEGTLFDILLNASECTTQNTGKLYVLYDDIGKLCLKNVESLYVPFVIDKETAGSFSYSSSIDKNVYNRVKIAYDNDTTGAREVAVVNDSYTQSVWGVLQYYEKVKDSGALAEMGKIKLGIYNRKQRSLSVRKCRGDVRVRGGTSVFVKLDLGDIGVQNNMVVEKVKHTFSNNQHYMDLDLCGGDFYA